MQIPLQPKIYHIVHIGRMDSIVRDGQLLCDATISRRTAEVGTAIGINNIKKRRLEELRLSSHPELYVGDCVPFYFCPRSVMLYVIYRGNHTGLVYRDGQSPIVHLEADLRQSVTWADSAMRRWAFTDSNAGSFYFEDYSDLRDLGKLDWEAIEATDWRGRQEGKQAEFLVQESFPWDLIERIGVHSAMAQEKVLEALKDSQHKPLVEIRSDWYY